MMTIQCKGIKKFYIEGDNKVEALRGVDLEVYDDKLTLLVGPSGSGKTTLLSIIHTILTPDEGELYILGKCVNTMSEFEKAQLRIQSIGIIFQALHLIPTLTVLENIILPLVIKGEDEEESKKKGMHILEQLRIDSKAEYPPRHLSRGQQQRVAIGRALVNDPRIIICDEPTSALDQKAGFEFMSILKDLVAHGNRTVFVVTHDQRIFPFADRIISINDGTVEEKHE